ncbi:MAG: hypothetical protein E3J83_03340 [Candidatus Atribacteria bacterium]|nr:MAG: hypothetical protein E3J83_03340 [Candidatus Atribacteria bacterium]
MDNKIVLIKSKKQKQIDFLKKLVKEPRDRAKDSLMKQTDRAIEAIVEFKADLVTNGINTHIYDFDYNDTADIFKPLKEIIGYMDFIIETEVNRIVEISLESTLDEINYMEEKALHERAKKLLQKRKEKADKEHDKTVTKLRNKNGTIFFNY